MRELLKLIHFIMLEKKDVLLSILFGFLAGITGIALIGTNGYLISKAALQPPLYVLIIMVGVVKLGSFIRAASRYAERYYSHRATFTMLSHLRVYFYERLEQLGPKIFFTYRSGDLLARIVGDVESLQNFFLRVLYPPIIMLLVFLSTILFTTYYSLYLTVILVFGLLVTGLVIPALFAVRQRKIGSTVREKRAILSTEVTEFLYGFRDLKIHQKLEEKERQLLAASGTYIQEQEQEGTHLLYSQAVNMALALLVAWSMLTMGAYFVTSGQLDGLFLAMLVMITLTVFEHSTPVASFSVYYEDSRRATERLFSVVQQDAPVAHPATEEALQSPTAPSIEVERVSFAFPGESRLSLEEVTLSLPKGSKTALVGPSGSGKSTLLQLLLKFYSPQEGTIRRDGLSLAELDQERIWKRSNVILQENHFFYGTIKDNLLLATDECTDEQLKEILDAVQLGNFSLFDPVFEKGENLSGGEKQRLAMARAMLKGASLWLLDEPTSSLDVLTEQRLYEHLFRQAADDTVVIVSHRLTGLERMDQIIVMEQGCIVESGTFDQLMDKKGYFYQMKMIEQSVL